MSDARRNVLRQGRQLPPREPQGVGRQLRPHLPKVTMPRYGYKCTACLHEFVGYNSMSKCREDVACEKCGKASRRDLRVEGDRLQQARTGELPDWVSIGAGVAPAQAADASRQYAHLGVTFDSSGRAHVPGKNRQRFLRERGLVEL